MGRDIWHMTESHCFHSQELPLLGLAGVLYDLPGLTCCHCDSIGLVSLIPLGWELRVLHHCAMCTRHLDLVSVDFLCHPHSDLKNFYIYLYTEYYHTV